MPISPRIKRPEPETEKHLCPDPKFTTTCTCTFTFLHGVEIILARDELISVGVISIKNAGMV
jgi:hypothetical protein